ncbi:MAG: type II secretion system major pseudopilin GspG [Planctomycetota bacterium]|jgi:general secretion pathway protein G
MTVRRESRGFTLVEMMVVVVIIGILAAVVVTSAVHYADKARINATKAQISEIETALAGFKLETGRYPTGQEGIKALVEKPADFKGDWPKDGFLPSLPLDAWGNEFVYVCPGASRSFDIVSYGADGIEGGDDENTDITN